MGKKKPRVRKTMKVTPDPGRWEGEGRTGKKGSIASHLSSSIDLSGLKVQMSMDLNHLEVIIFLTAQ